MQLFRNAPLGIGVAVLVILASSLAWFTLPFIAAVRVEVQLPVFDVDRIGVGSQLNVTLSNAGSSPIAASFWVVWSAYVRQWTVLQGPLSVAPGSTGRYVIRPSDIQTAIPDGAPFVVKAYIPDSSTYYRSATVELHLVSNASIRNPDLRFWSRNIATGVYEPLAWSAGASGGTDDMTTIAAQVTGVGADLTLREGGTGPEVSYIHLQQAVGVTGVNRLYLTGMTLCWRQTVDYRSDSTSGGPLAASGLELSVGSQRAWFAISSNRSVVYDLPGHRIFVSQADPTRPGCASVPIRGMIDFADPGLQSPALLIFFVAAWPSAPGTYLFSPTSVS